MRYEFDRIGVNPSGWTLEVRRIRRVWPGQSIIERRKDLAMRNRRGFSLEFKRQVVEELMSGASGPAQLCRRYDIATSLLWRIGYGVSRRRHPAGVLGDEAFKKQLLA